jgi:hypothetical protein
MMYVRLVHLLDAEKRKELMIIYGEDLAPPDSRRRTCARAGKQPAGGQLLKGLIERAKTKIALEDTGKPRFFWQLFE